jgi:hypothetical protein
MGLYCMQEADAADGAQLRIMGAAEACDRAFWHHTRCPSVSKCQMQQSMHKSYLDLHLLVLSFVLFLFSLLPFDNNSLLSWTCTCTSADRTLKWQIMWLWSRPREAGRAPSLASAPAAANRVRGAGGRGRPRKQLWQRM